MPRRRWSVLLAGVALACASAPARPEGPTLAETAPATGTLFERLGGMRGIETVVDDFLARVSQDERINAGFAFSPVPRVRQRLVEQFCQATGGPCTYSGRSMKAVHAGMGITTAQFDALAGHLAAALAAAKARPEDQKAVMAVAGGMRGDIVEAP